MPRKPNYRFERAERDRAKAVKKAERLKAKREKAADRKAGITRVDADADTDADSGVEHSAGQE